MPNDHPSDLLSTLQVARRWGVHIRTVHRLVQRGDLKPAVRAPGVRGAYLFRSEDVDNVDRVTTTRMAS